VGSVRVRSSWRGAIATGAVIIATVVGSLAVPAGARSRAVPDAGPDRRQVAGLLGTASGASATVSAKFKVPTVTCPDGGPDFAGTTDGVVAYTHDSFSDAGVAVGCFGNEPLYAGLIDINGSQTQFPDVVNPGDSITVSVVSQTGGTTEATVRNKTQNWRHTLTATGSDAVEEVGAGAIAFNCLAGACSPVAQYTNVRFYSSSFISLSTKAISKIKAADGSVEAKAAGLGLDPGVFTTKWLSTCGPVDGDGRC
jgi:hypothetical protein